MKFHSNTALVVNKSNRLLGLLKHCFVISTTFINLYKAIIRPVLEYGNTIWGPFYATDINNIENIQRKATKLVPTIHHLSYKDRLRSLKLPTLQYRRRRGDMIMLFNLLHDMYDFNISDLFTFTPNNHLTRGHQFKSFKYRSRTDLRKHSFSRRVINSWSNLPGGIADATSTDNFKHLF